MFVVKQKTAYEVRSSYWDSDVFSADLQRRADSEPVTLWSALAAVTTHIGFVATASTTYEDPYLLARKFASLDWLSRGRAGWNVVTTGGDASANFRHRMSVV